jgi:hypothetical protein
MTAATIADRLTELGAATRAWTETPFCRTLLHGATRAAGSGPGSQGELPALLQRPPGSPPGPNDRRPRPAAEFWAPTTPTPALTAVAGFRVVVIVDPSMAGYDRASGPALTTAGVAR